MIRRIVWGALAEPAALRHALGRLPGSHPVTLAHHHLARDPESRAPLLAAAPGASSEAVVLFGLSEAEHGILDFIDTAMGASESFLSDGVPGRRAPAGAATRPATAAELPADTALARVLIEELLAWKGEFPAEALAGRRRSLAVVAASRLRARQEAAPTTLRHEARPGDVAIAAHRHPYAAFFAMEEYDIAWRRFDGTMGAPATRGVFLSGDAVTVLPYDPVRDRVLIVEQHRAGPQARGDTQPWQFEPVAGRIDPGETPESTAIRESMEEAGLAIALADLRFVARYYPSPGAVTEYVYSYVGLADLPDGAAGVHGLDHEEEDIRGHLVPFGRLMALVENGEVQSAPLILTALWLQRERPALRATPKPPA